jgi:nitroreductase
MAINQQSAEVKEKAETFVNTLIGHVIPSAILAASAHNTQPWKFKVIGNTVDVLVDWDRHLAVSDPSLRELYISIGCAITNILVAAKYWDYKPELTYFPEGENKKSPVARIVCNKTNHSSNSINAVLFTAIVNRRTDRNTYDKQLLTNDEKKALPTINNEGVILLEDKDKIDKIAKLTEEATIRTLSRKDFKEELSHWVRNNWTSQHDGMPGYAMGIPAPLSLLGSIMVRLAPIHKQEGPKTKEQMNSSSAVIIIGSETDSLVNWVKSGQTMEQVWLEATAIGLSVAPLIASVEAGKDTRSKLKKILGTNLSPQSILRIGHTHHKPLRSSPRRTLEECLI